MTSTERLAVAVAVLAAGSGSRFGSEVNKAYIPLDGEPMVLRSLRRATELADVSTVLLVVAESDRPLARQTLRAVGLDAVVEVVVGGETRHASEWAMLQTLEARITEGAITLVVIHDGARPYATPQLFRDIIDQADIHGGAIPGHTQPAVVPVDPDLELGGHLVAVQTPQAFRAGDLLDAYRQADIDGFEGTDTASTVERFAALDVVVVPGPAANLKITYPGDVAGAGVRRT